MDKSQSLLRQYGGSAFFGAGIVLCAAAIGLIVSHARLFSEKRDTAVMVGTSLPEQRSEVALLSANVEAEQAFQRDALVAKEEQASVYVLPDASPVPRAVRSIQETVLALAQDGKETIALEQLSFDENISEHGSYKSLSGSFVLRGTFQSVARFLGILSFSGDMILKDALPADSEQAFLKQVEASAPLSLRSAEDFLYLDLLQYASNPDLAEQRMLKDMPSEVASDVRSFILQSGAADVRGALSKVAKRLAERTIWPLPLLRVDHVIRDGNKWTVNVTLFGR